MLKRFFRLAVFLSYLVFAHDDTSAEIDELASIRGFDIAGLHKSSNLLACLKSYNCKPLRLGDSTWRTELVGTIPDIAHEKRQCGPNLYGVVDTIVTLGLGQVEYGSIPPYDMVQDTENICSDGGCDSNTYATYESVSITKNNTDFTAFNLSAKATGIYPTTQFRDAMINIAALTVNQTTTTNWFSWQNCGYEDPCFGGDIPQITAINYVQVDIYGTDTTLNQYLIATYSVSINQIAPSPNRDYLWCQTFISEAFNIISIFNPWLYLLAPVNLACLIGVPAR
jgi:hypothetical protein